jgi:hypothetical protein
MCIVPWHEKVQGSGAPQEGQVVLEVELYNLSPALQVPKDSTALYLWKTTDLS